METRLEWNDIFFSLCVIVYCALSLRPVAALCHKIGQLLQPDTVDIVEAILHGAVDINYGNHFTVYNNGNNYLAAAVAVASDMPRKYIHVRYELCLSRRSGGAANTSPKSDSLACDLALERAEDELWLCWRRKGVECVEASPIYGV